MLPMPVRVALAVALLANLARAQKMDWLIVPGQRVGPITASTTRAELDAMFGKENVQERNLGISQGPEAATVVFGDDASVALAITWDLGKGMARTEWDRDMKYPAVEKIKYTEVIQPTLGFVTDDKGSSPQSFAVPSASLEIDATAGKQTVVLTGVLNLGSATLMI